MILDGVWHHWFIHTFDSDAALGAPLLPTCIEQPEGGLFSVAFFYFRLVVCKIFERLNKEQWRTVRHCSFGWQSRHDIAGDLVRRRTTALLYRPCGRNDVPRWYV